MQLRPADNDTLWYLMQQFSSAAALKQWGGEGFAFPIRRQQFLSHLLLKDTQGFCLQNPQGQFIGFGQLCDRFGCHHLARLLILPPYRGKGLAACLIKALIAKGLAVDPKRDISLYVFGDNLAARRCYQRLGFQEATHPAEFRADLLFMRLSNAQAQQLLSDSHANHHRDSHTAARETIG